MVDGNDPRHKTVPAQHVHLELKGKKGQKREEKGKGEP